MTENYAACLVVFCLKNVNSIMENFTFYEKIDSFPFSELSDELTLEVET